MVDAIVRMPDYILNKPRFAFMFRFLFQVIVLETLYVQTYFCTSPPVPLNPKPLNPNVLYPGTRDHCGVQAMAPRFGLSKLARGAGIPPVPRLIYHGDYTELVQAYIEAYRVEWVKTQAMEN